MLPPPPSSSPGPFTAKATAKATALRYWHRKNPHHRPLPSFLLSKLSPLPTLLRRPLFYHLLRHHPRSPLPSALPATFSAPLPTPLPLRPTSPTITMPTSPPTVTHSPVAATLSRSTPPTPTPLPTPSAATPSAPFARTPTPTPTSSAPPSILYFLPFLSIAGHRRPPLLARLLLHLLPLHQTPCHYTTSSSTSHHRPPLLACLLLHFLPFLSVVATTDLFSFSPLLHPPLPHHRLAN